MVNFKMVGRHWNEWQETQLRLAFKEGNAQEIEYLRKKKSYNLCRTLSCADMTNINAEMVDIFINKFTDKDWQRWGAKPGSRDGMLFFLMSRTMRYGHDELFEKFFNAGLDLNTNTAEVNPITSILLSKMDKKKAAEIIQKIVDKGIDKIADAKGFVETALNFGAPESFDILVKATGTDIHANNEEYLRKAAEAGNTKMARHLVENHSSDITVAITTERTFGHDKSWQFLDTLRLERDPSGRAAPTIESLSAEMQAMKETIRELTERITILSPPSPNKPLIKAPTQAVQPQK